MEIVSRETIELMARLDNAGVNPVCGDCAFEAAWLQVIKEGWTLRLEGEICRCPFCQHLRDRGADAPLSICLSSPSNLNSIQGENDEEIPY